MERDGTGGVNDPYGDMDNRYNTGGMDQAYNKENAYKDAIGTESVERFPHASPIPVHAEARPSQALDSQAGSECETITLGMGCFWGPEALFGRIPGVLRTRVGYAGGTTEQPTYREMGDHSETVEVDFDPQIVTLEQLLELFWKHHKPVNINEYKGRQYWSLALYRSGEQREAIERVKRRLEQESGVPLDTEATAFRAFYLAEARHRKYYLKRFPEAVAKLDELYGAEEQWERSTLAARLNGLAKGYTSMERIAEELRLWPAAMGDGGLLLAAIRRIRW